MPSGILESESGMPNLNKYQSADEKINAIQSYLFMLIEQLRWSLRNLGVENFNEVDLQKITEPIYARIKGADDAIAELIVTGEEIATKVTNVEGSVSTVQQTARGLQSSVSDLSGKYSSLQLTADGLQSTVGDLNGKYTSLKQTVDGFDFTGYVQFDDLSTDGSTIINGANIKTGRLDADYIGLDGGLEVYYGRTFGGYLGYIQGTNSDGEATNGIGFISDTNTQRFGGQIYATDSGARMCYASQETKKAYGEVDSSVTCTTNGVFVRGGAFEYEDAPVSTSDRNKKEDIRNLGDAYNDLFDRLEPVSFKFKGGRSGRMHTGLIAQDVRQAIQDAGLSTQDFAAYVEYQDEDANDSCGLRYGEFIGLLIDQVQRLKKRVDELEQKGGGTDAT